MHLCFQWIFHLQHHARIGAVIVYQICRDIWQGKISQPWTQQQRCLHGSFYYAMWCIYFSGIKMMSTLIARFMGPTWGPSGADRTQVGPMLAPWTLLSGYTWNKAPWQYHLELNHLNFEIISTVSGNSHKIQMIDSRRYSQNFSQIHIYFVQHISWHMRIHM